MSLGDALLKFILDNNLGDQLEIFLQANKDNIELEEEDEDSTRELKPRFVYYSEDIH